MKAVFEWGLQGALTHNDNADALVIVDVLSFSTCVDIALSQGAIVFPCAYGDQELAAAEAQRLRAELAGPRGDPAARYSLSPVTLQEMVDGTRLLLPSPNGSQISQSVVGKPVLTGCLRNADAVASAAAELVRDGTLAVIAAGERWGDGSLRPAIEDLLGAGAILDALNAELSAEAITARDAFLSAQSRLDKTIQQSVSGRELIDKGFPQDVEVAVKLNSSDCAPLLSNGAYQRY